MPRMPKSATRRALSCVIHCFRVVSSSARSYSGVISGASLKSWRVWGLGFSGLGVGRDRGFIISEGYEVSPQTLMLLICVESLAKFDEMTNNCDLCNLERKLDL